MERDSFGYILRRKIQVFAHKLIPDEMLSKIYYRIVVGKSLNLKNPRTFNEKLQWLKLYYFPYDPLVVQCADKFTVREYVKQKRLEGLLVPMIASWNKVSQINWEDLPNKFMLKCNHGCAYNILCSNKRAFDINAAEKMLNTWLKEDFGAFNIELHYSNIRNHKIICEEYLGDCITDYKFFCFNGVPKFIYVSTDLIHDRKAKIGFFDLDGTKMSLKRNDYADMSKVVLPTFFKEMLGAAKILCKDFPFVRVDFFLANGTYYFAELTFTPSACMMPFNPDWYDLEWGDLLDISMYKKKEDW